MFEVVLDEIKYIKDVPQEMTDEAILQGCIRKGAVVGLTVHPTEDEDNKVLLDVRLTREGQEKLLTPGARIPLDGQGSTYLISEGWEQYLISETPFECGKSTDCLEKSDSSKPSPRGF